MSVEENKAVIRRYFDEVRNGKNLDVLDDILDVNYTSGGRNREEWKEFVAWLHSAFPDERLTVDELIAEGDKVVARWTSHATDNGGMGLPGTGKQFEWRGVNIYRVVDGRIVEQQGITDWLSVARQLGITQVPPQ
jgi:predicted ester cyclase